MEKYVLGFAFSDDRKHVALIRKQRPDWQMNRLNGLGGKIQKKESSIQAMIREFYEESGVKTETWYWKPFLKMEGKGWSVDCFLMFDFDLNQLKTQTDEDIVIINVMDIITGVYPVVDNLKWIIPIALDENILYSTTSYK